MRNVLTTSILAGALMLASAGVANADWEAGVAAFKAGDFSRAAQEFQAVVEGKPEFSGGHYMLGQALLKTGDARSALNHFRKAYELDSSNLSYTFALGKAYHDNQRYAEAVQILKKIDPTTLPEAQRSAHQQMLASALNNSGRYDEALSTLRQMAESNPRSASAWYTYGTAALGAGEIDQATRALNRAVELDAGDAKKKETYIKAMIQKARRTRDSAAKKGVYGEAVSVAKSLVSSNGSFENLLLLGEVQLGAGDYNDAVATLGRATRQRSNDFYAHFYTAQAYSSLKKWEDAESAARKALELANQDRAKKLAWRQIGFVAEKLKNFEDAKVAYRNAGDQAGVRRVEENQRIAEENARIEEENQRIEELREQEEELQKALEELEGGSEPPLR